LQAFAFVLLIFVNQQCLQMFLASLLMLAQNRMLQPFLRLVRFRHLLHLLSRIEDFL
jgi:hypothetical protein